MSCPQKARFEMAAFQKIHKQRHHLFAQSNTAILGFNNKKSELGRFSAAHQQHESNNAPAMLANPDTIRVRIKLPVKLSEALRNITFKRKPILILPMIKMTMEI